MNNRNVCSVLMRNICGGARHTAVSGDNRNWLIILVKCGGAIYAHGMRNV
ncbi:hypothetical protein BN136_2869 [Cronobacter universalis NCTC 9529]|nr:hypothetical protein BN136_2869 [Cronobacter universalis NCTC 9529]